MERAAAARVEAEVEMASTLPELHKYRCSQESRTSERRTLCRASCRSRLCTSRQPSFPPWPHGSCTWDEMRGTYMRWHHAKWSTPGAIALPSMVRSARLTKSSRGKARPARVYGVNTHEPMGYDLGSHAAWHVCSMRYAERTRAWSAGIIERCASFVGEAWESRNAQRCRHPDLA